MLNLLGSAFGFLVNIVKNLFRYGVQGALLVGIATVGFVFIARYVKNTVLLVVVQVAVMSLALYFMDRILGFIFPNRCPAPEALPSQDISFATPVPVQIVNQDEN